MKACLIFVFFPRAWQEHFCGFHKLYADLVFLNWAMDTPRGTIHSRRYPDGVLDQTILKE